MEEALKTPVSIQQTAVTYTDTITTSLCQLMGKQESSIINVELYVRIYLSIEITSYQTPRIISDDSLLEAFSQMKKLVSVKEAENMSRIKEQEEMIEQL